MKIKLKDIIEISEHEQLLSESLSILKEIQLNIKNAAKINGGINKGTFTVDDIVYDYTTTDYPSNIVLPGDKDNIRLEGTVCDLGFTEQGGGTDFASNLPKGGRANLIKIYSTMYKIILTIAKTKTPNNILLSSYDQSGYFPYYNNLTKTNNIPGYSRKAVVKWVHNGKNITSIVLKKNNSN
jgi:hypothetical protein